MTFDNIVGLCIWQCFLHHSSVNHKSTVFGYNAKYYFTLAVQDVEITCTYLGGIMPRICHNLYPVINGKSWNTEGISKRNALVV